MHTYVCTRVCACVCMCMCVPMCMSVCACVYAYACVHVCLCACVHVHMCTCACVYACMCVSVCVCACVCELVCAWPSPLMGSPCLQGAPPRGDRQALAARGGPLLLLSGSTGPRWTTTRNGSFSQTHCAASRCQADAQRVRGRVLTCGLSVCSGRAGRDLCAPAFTTGGGAASPVL